MNRGNRDEGFRDFLFCISGSFFVAQGLAALVTPDKDVFGWLITVALLVFGFLSLKQGVFS